MEMLLKAFLNTQMEMLLKAFLKMIKEKEKEFLNIQMVVFIRVSGKTIFYLKLNKIELGKVKNYKWMVLSFN